MASIRKFKTKRKVIETKIPGFFIQALTIKESKKLAAKHQGLTEEDLRSEAKAAELTMSLFSLACDENGEAFEEFATFELIEELDLDEFNAFAEAIKEALVPGTASEKK